MMDTTTKISDFLLWRSFKSGDKDALSTIFKANYDSLLNYGLKIHADKDLIKDCVQDVFLKLWNNRDSLCEIQHIKPYLIKALRRKIQDELMLNIKKSKKLEQYNPDENFTFSYEDLLVSDQIDSERKEKLLACLNTLPKRQRELIYLRFFENLDYEKIAIIMNLNMQSVRNLSFTTIKGLKSDLIYSALLLVLSCSQ